MNISEYKVVILFSKLTILMHCCWIYLRKHRENIIEKHFTLVTNLVRYSKVIIYGRETLVN